MRSLLGELERAHGVTEAMRSVDAQSLGGAESARLTELLKAAAEALDEAVTIVVRAGRARGKDYARSDSTAGVEAPVNEPHQASVGSDEPHPSQDP